MIISWLHYSSSQIFTESCSRHTHMSDETLRKFKIRKKNFNFSKIQQRWVDFESLIRQSINNNFWTRSLMMQWRWLTTFVWSWRLTKFIRVMRHPSLIFNEKNNFFLLVEHIQLRLSAFKCSIHITSIMQAQLRHESGDNWTFKKYVEEFRYREWGAIDETTSFSHLF